ncbi:hypothetical protein [Vitreimonas flagellata]|uniref:hypothetical protein n=1 Tax=Vitreimonas flagellata TaxID=2560861 RepID=UPI001074DA61|nr:hypothetical protein [Vitreimonas flagellata]
MPVERSAKDQRPSIFRTLVSVAFAALASGIVGNAAGVAIALIVYGEAYPVDAHLTGIAISFAILFAVGVLIFLPIHWLLTRFSPSVVSYSLVGVVLGCGLSVAILRPFVRMEYMRQSEGAGFLQSWHGLIEISAICILSMIVFALVFWSIRRPDRDLSIS